MQKFHKVGLNENDTLIIVGDTGLSAEEGYEALHRLAWFKDQNYNVFVVSLKDNFNEELEAILDDGDEKEPKKTVVNLYGGRVYVINGLKYLIVNESTSLETITGLEVDYVLATNYFLMGKIRNRVKFKHCYIGEAYDVIDESTTALSEDIIPLNLSCASEGAKK